MSQKIWTSTKHLGPVKGQGTKVKEVLGKDILNPVCIQVLKTSLVLGPFKNNAVKKGWLSRWFTNCQVLSKMVKILSTYFLNDPFL